LVEVVGLEGSLISRTGRSESLVVKLDRWVSLGDLVDLDRVLPEMDHERFEGFEDEA